VDFDEQHENLCQRVVFRSLKRARVQAKTFIGLTSHRNGLHESRERFVNLIAYRVRSVILVRKVVDGNVE
jgi:hypothetical protein